MTRVGSVLAGAACGLVSAVLFGASTPFSKLLLPKIDPILLAGLLYLGAGAGASAPKIAGIPLPGGPHRALCAADSWPIAGVILFGGLLGPVLMLIGLTRVSALSGSLLLNLEGPFTVLLALAAFGERLAPAERIAVALVLGAAVVLSYHPGPLHGTWTGAAAIAGACLSWGLDNNLTRRLSGADPLRLVQIKGFAAGTTNVVVGLAIGTRWPPLTPIGAALGVGAVSYGASIVFDIYALRYVGAAREAAFFATAPFAGAAMSLVLLHEPMTPFDMAGGLLMAIGVVVLVRARA